MKKTLFVSAVMVFLMSWETIASPKSFSGKVCFDLSISHNRERLQAGAGFEQKIQLKLGQLQTENRFLRKYLKYLPHSILHERLSRMSLNVRGFRNMILDLIDVSKTKIKTWKGMAVYQYRHRIRVAKINERIEAINKYRESLAVLARLRIAFLTTPPIHVFCVQAAKDGHVMKLPGQRIVNRFKAGVEMQVRGGHHGWAEVSYPVGGRQKIGWVRTHLLQPSPFLGRCVRDARQQVRTQIR